jgi:catechol 2,3-dioxygenase-like lactoylglutathione lyase family enzyme
MSRGFSHVGLSTHNMAETCRFYEETLGFSRVVDEITHVDQGGRLRQVFFDVGEGQYVVFMEPKGVPGIASDYDPGINSALGTPAGMYHFAFRETSLESLEARRQSLLDAGVEVSDIIDLGTAKSVFLSDPNNIQLEFAYHTRPFDPSDLLRVSHATVAIAE